MAKAPSAAMSFAAQLRGSLEHLELKQHEPPRQSDAQLEKFALACPFYATHLLAHPTDWISLQNSLELGGPLHRLDYPRLWAGFTREAGQLSLENTFALLRRFRRIQSMRIAYAELNLLYSVEAAMEDHSALAEFCIEVVAKNSYPHFEERFGTPWLHTSQSPCSYTILALGKLGGNELNFCSDVDLIFIYENEGECQKSGKTTLSNREFYERFFQEVRSTIHTKTPDGFLFNVDLRLRPEGEKSAIAKSLPFTENYYWSRGQTWERMALIKARPIAGNKELGEELLETLNPFRYPQFLSKSILDEIAALKQRVELEALKGSDPKQNIKSGEGGIREIEYIAQALQLLHAGKTPFIQCTQTLKALNRLHRYKLLPKKETQTLQSAYSFLRSVENRLQMRLEKQTHSLPNSHEEQKLLAQSLDIKDYHTLSEKLKHAREAVHRSYLDLFKTQTPDSMQGAWRLSLSRGEITPALEEKLATWFPDKRGFQAIQKLITGSLNNQINEEQIRLCSELSTQFDSIFPELASPTLAIERLAQLAEKYGARIPWIKACISKPQFFKTLCLLFDRSEFIAELLTKHPEILEELLIVNITQRKNKQALIADIEKLPQGETFPHYLWLYVKAEQVRTAICSILTEWNLSTVQAHLTTLADATLHVILERVDPEASLTVIALGKYGSCELTYGSDLDLILLSKTEPLESEKIKYLQRILHHKTFTHSIYLTDFRLRPYGIDGPMACSIKQLKHYYSQHAQTWEKQTLTRSRFIHGDPELREAFEEFKEELLFSKKPEATLIDEVRNMHATIQKNKANTTTPEHAFKACQGGIVHCEFAAQSIQLSLGYKHPELKQGNTLKTFEAALRLRTFEDTLLTPLIRGYLFLTKLELFLRRNKNVAITQLPSSALEQERLAQWLGFGSFQKFWAHYTDILRDNHKSIECIFDKLKPK